MPKKTLKTLLSTVKSVRVAEIRAAVEGEETTGNKFAVVATISGPFALVGLVVGTDIIIKKSVPGTRVIEIPLGALPARPFDISWTVLAGHAIPELGAFLNFDGTILKLGEKKKLEKGKLWAGSRTIV